MDVWFCRVAGEIFGPLDSASVRDMAAQGLIDAETETRNGAGGRWQPLGEIQGLLTPCEAVAFVETPAEADTARKPEPRYKALQTVATNIRSLGNLLLLVYFVGSALVLLGALVFTFTNKNAHGILEGLTALIVCGIWLPIVLLIRALIHAGAEMILLAISAEAGVWESARHLQAIREQMAGAAAHE